MELFKVDTGLTIWMFVAFAILFFILWKFAWPVIMKTIDGRADLIDKGVEYAQNAKEQLDNAQLTAEKQIQEARHKEADIIAEANRMKSQIIEVSRVALHIAGQVTRQDLSNQAAQKKLVNTYLDEIESNNKN